MRFMVGFFVLNCPRVDMLAKSKAKVICVGGGMPKTVCKRSGELEGWVLLAALND